MDVFAALVIATCALGGAPQGEVLDFSATWCGPCQQMGPIVDRLHRQGYPIRKIDVDQHPDLVRKYGIGPIPAFVLVVNGKAVERLVGRQSEQELLTMLSKVPKAAPDFPQSRPDQPIIAKAASQPTAPIRPAVWKATEEPRRTVFGLPAFGSKKTPVEKVAQATPAKQAAPVIRAKLDDQPLRVNATLTRDPMVASIRIRISDKGGVNLGSGTIVESKVGQTLILTCGHIFRNSQPDALIEVDVFTNGKSETFVGKPVKHDLELDLGVISIPTDSPLSYAQIASGDYQVAKGAAVQSVGCGQGNVPTLQKHLVTQLNRYKGPSNIECTGVPIQGRSGGGLFNQQGEVVGICMAADPKERRGLYVGLPAIHGFLKSCDLLRLLRNGISPDAELPAQEESVEDPAVEEVEEAVIAQQTPRQPARRGLAALEAALGTDADGVICLVRSDSASQNRQRVVVLTGNPATIHSDSSSRVRATSTR